MSEIYKNAAEWEDDRPEKIVSYEDGGSSAIIVSEPGEIVDLYKDKHKYLRSPEMNPSGKILIAGHTEDGEQVRLVMDGSYSVAFGKRADGKQFAEVSHTTEGDYQNISGSFTIGEQHDGFPGMIVDSVGAQYKAFGGGATEEAKEQNPFSIAERLVERAKHAKR